jgi:predicted RNA-binding Zn-ribbon protein involved in translation (DUF1610 family)
MKVCVRCLAEMTCERTGLGVRFGQAHVYPGDMFKCPKCGAEIIVTSGQPTHDPESRIETLQMKTRGD